MSSLRPFEDSPGRWLATALLLCVLLPSLAVAGPMANYARLPDCCRDECTTDRCPIEARRAARAQQPKPREAGPTEHAEPAPSCHEEPQTAAEDAVTTPTYAYAQGAHSGHGAPSHVDEGRDAYGNLSLQAPSHCGSSSDGLTPIPRSELPTQTVGAPGSVRVEQASTPTASPQTQRFVGAEPRGPPQDFLALH